MLTHKNPGLYPLSLVYAVLESCSDGQIDLPHPPSPPAGLFRVNEVKFCYDSLMQVFTSCNNLMNSWIFKTTEEKKLIKTKPFYNSIDFNKQLLTIQALSWWN